MIKAPASLKPDALADWMEASALIDERGEISRAEFIGVLDGVGLSDEKVDEIMGELARQATSRDRYLGNLYPLNATEGGYAPRDAWQNYLVYSFMLLCSLGRHYKELTFGNGTASRPGELFGFVSVEALASYLGGEAFRVDAPRRQPVPKEFQKMLEYLQTRSQERKSSDVHTTGDEQDDGLDVIGWRPFGDSRGGQVIVIGQCAVGNDWKNKLGQLDAYTWTRHMKWHVEPVRALMLPWHFVGTQTAWEKICGKGGIVFDRLRVARWATDASLPEGLRRNLETWCERRIKNLRTLPVLAG